MKATVGRQLGCIDCAVPTVPSFMSTPLHPFIVLIARTVGTASAHVRFPGKGRQRLETAIGFRLA